jgi:putative transposase
VARARKRHDQLAITEFRRRPDKNGQWRGAPRYADLTAAERRKAKKRGPIPKGKRASEAHRVRPELAAIHPVHVILRAVADIGSLRKHAVFRAVREATRTIAVREVAFRIAHFSIQRTHIHLIVEAADKEALSRGMQAFGISAARHINRELGPWRGKKQRKGPVFADRYHAVVLTTPKQVRHTLCYVLNNWKHHGETTASLRGHWNVDPYSSAVSFDGWLDVARVGRVGYLAPMVWEPQTWLLRVGWKRHGLISFHEVPGGGSE